MIVFVCLQLTSYDELKYMEIVILMISLGINHSDDEGCMNSDLC